LASANRPSRSDLDDPERSGGLGAAIRAELPNFFPLRQGRIEAVELDDSSHMQTVPNGSHFHNLIHSSM